MIMQHALLEEIERLTITLWHERVRRKEVERLRGLLDEALAAWEGSEPRILLDRIRAALEDSK